METNDHDTTPNDYEERPADASATPDLDEELDLSDEDEFANLDLSDDDTGEISVGDILGNSEDSSHTNNVDGESLPTISYSSFLGPRKDVDPEIMSSFNDNSNEILSTLHSISDFGGISKGQYVNAATDVTNNLNNLERSLVALSNENVDLRYSGAVTARHQNYDGPATVAKIVTNADELSALLSSENAPVTANKVIANFIQESLSGIHSLSDPDRRVELRGDYVAVIPEGDVSEPVRASVTKAALAGAKNFIGDIAFRKDALIRSLTDIGVSSRLAKKVATQLQIKGVAVDHGELEHSSNGLKGRVVEALQAAPNSFGKILVSPLAAATTYLGNSFVRFASNGENPHGSEPFKDASSLLDDRSIIDSDAQNSFLTALDSHYSAFQNDLARHYARNTDDTIERLGLAITEVVSKYAPPILSQQLSESLIEHVVSALSTRASLSPKELVSFLDTISEENGDDVLSGLQEQAIEKTEAHKEEIAKQQKDVFLAHALLSVAGEDMLDDEQEERLFHMLQEDDVLRKDATQKMVALFAQQCDSFSDNERTDLVTAFSEQLCSLDSASFESKEAFSAAMNTIFPNTVALHNQPFSTPNVRETLVRAISNSLSEIPTSALLREDLQTNSTTFYDVVSTSARQALVDLPSHVVDQLVPMYVQSLQNTLSAGDDEETVFNTVCSLFSSEQFSDLEQKYNEHRRSSFVDHVSKELARTKRLTGDFSEFAGFDISAGQSMLTKQQVGTTGARRNTNDIVPRESLELSVANMLDDTGTALVLGASGMGKTVLAKRVQSAYASRHNQQAIHVECRREFMQTPHYVARELLSAVVGTRDTKHALSSLGELLSSRDDKAVHLHTAEQLFLEKADDKSFAGKVSNLLTALFEAHAGKYTVLIDDWQHADVDSVSQIAALSQDKNVSTLITAWPENKEELVKTNDAYTHYASVPSQVDLSTATLTDDEIRHILVNRLESHTSIDRVPSDTLDLLVAASHNNPYRASTLGAALSPLALKKKELLEQIPDDRVDFAGYIYSQLGLQAVPVLAAAMNSNSDISQDRAERIIFHSDTMTQYDLQEAVSSLVSRGVVQEAENGSLQPRDYQFFRDISESFLQDSPAQAAKMSGMVVASQLHDLFGSVDPLVHERIDSFAHKVAALSVDEAVALSFALDRDHAAKQDASNREVRVAATFALGKKLQDLVAADAALEQYAIVAKELEDTRDMDEFELWQRSRLETSNIFLTLKSDRQSGFESAKQLEEKTLEDGRITSAGIVAKAQLMAIRALQGQEQNIEEVAVDIERYLPVATPLDQTNVLSLVGGVVATHVDVDRGIGYLLKSLNLANSLDSLEAKNRAFKAIGGVAKRYAHKERFEDAYEFIQQHTASFEQALSSEGPSAFSLLNGVSAALSNGVRDGCLLANDPEKRNNALLNAYKGFKHCYHLNKLGYFPKLNNNICEAIQEIENYAKEREIILE